MSEQARVGYLDSHGQFQPVEMYAEDSVASDGVNADEHITDADIHLSDVIAPGEYFGKFTIDGTGRVTDVTPVQGMELPDIPWSKIIDKPNTLAGFGIYNAMNTGMTPIPAGSISHVISMPSGVYFADTNVTDLPVDTTNSGFTVLWCKNPNMMPAQGYILVCANMGSQPIYKRNVYNGNLQGSWTELLTANTGVLKAGDTMTGGLTFSGNISQPITLQRTDNKADIWHGVSSFILRKFSNSHRRIEFLINAANTDGTLPASALQVQGYNDSGLTTGIHNIWGHHNLPVETGTWTPTIGSAGIQSMTVGMAAYNRIGNWYHVYFRADAWVFTGSVGITVNGLPASPATTPSGEIIYRGNMTCGNRVGHSQIRYTTGTGVTFNVFITSAVSGAVTSAGMTAANAGTQADGAWIFECVYSANP